MNDTFEIELPVVMFKMTEDGKYICPVGDMVCSHYKQGICTCNDPYYNCEDFADYYDDGEEEND